MQSNTTEFFKRLKATTGTKAKRSLIGTHITDPTIEKIFRLALDSKIRSGVKLKPNDLLVDDTTSDLPKFIEFYEANLPFRTNLQKANLEEALEALSVEDQDLAIRMVNKDLNVGVGGTMVNGELKKAGMPLIRILNPTKAYKEKEVNLDNFNYPAYAQEKVDAARAFIVINDENTYILSSGGEVVTTLPFVTNGLSESRRSYYEKDYKYVPSVIDGEIVFLDENGERLPRRKSNGLFNKAIKGSISEDEAGQAVFIAWDILASLNDEDSTARNSSEELLYEDCPFAVQIPYVSRFEMLHNFLDVANDSRLVSDAIRVVETVEVENAGQAKAFSNEIIERGGEGAVLKDKGALYIPNRTKYLVKLKKSYMADVRVVGLNEGKNAGTLGSLQYETDDSQISGDVTGLPDNVKEMIWNGTLPIVGEIIEVCYMELSKNEKTGLYTLYGPPVFVRLRDDKADTSLVEELS